MKSTRKIGEKLRSKETEGGGVANNLKKLPEIKKRKKGGGQAGSQIGRLKEVEGAAERKGKRLGLPKQLVEIPKRRESLPNGRKEKKRIAIQTDQRKKITQTDVKTSCRQVKVETSWDQKSQRGEKAPAPEKGNGKRSGKKKRRKKARVDRDVTRIGGGRRNGRQAPQGPTTTLGGTRKKDGC